MMEIGETIEPHSQDDFARWLEEHGSSAKEIWVVIFKKTSGKQMVTYPELVETALRYGWIDGLAKSMDAECYAQRFSPRRKRSNWTETNKAIARRLVAEGLMTEAGMAALPEDMRSA
jgi:uncharacterized protein YdeI (YjbR/CyaY-like superfamily)